jgi:hypothetical protein
MSLYSIPDAIKEIVFQSALGSIRADKGIRDSKKLVGKIQAKVGFNDPGYFLPVLNVVRAALRSYQAGEALNPGEAPPGGPPPIPKDPSLYGSADPIVYRVVIEATDGIQKMDFAVNIGADRPLSFSEIRDRAIDAFSPEASFLERDYKTQIESLNTGYSLSVRVISAGRK